MTYEETIEVRRLLEDAVRAVSAANESASCQAQIAELEDSIRRLEMSGEGHHGWVAGGGGEIGEGPFSPVYEGSDGSSGSSSDDEEEPESKIVTALENCYYQVGGRTYKMADYTVPEGTSGFVALRISANSSTPNPSVQTYADLAALQEAQEDTAYVITPLYIMDAGEITLDMRRMPFIQLAEVF